MDFDGNALYPMTASLTAGRQWRSKLFTSSTTWTVPADVGCIWVDGCAGGGGGGGGDPTPGGGGGGGGPGGGCFGLMLPVVAGETLTLTIGSNGTGGAAGVNGGNGGDTQLVGAVCAWKAPGGKSGLKGTNPNGGSGGGNDIFSVDIGGEGGAGEGSSGRIYGQGTSNYFTSGSWDKSQCRISTGAAGGALNYNSGFTYRVDLAAGPLGETSPTPLRGLGGASGGGGGPGGSTYYGIGGGGAPSGTAGNNATGYGSGGGGGSGNSAGGNGSPGMIRIYCFTAYEI